MKLKVGGIVPTACIQTQLQYSMMSGMSLYSYSRIILFCLNKLLEHLERNCIRLNHCTINYSVGNKLLVATLILDINICKTLSQNLYYIKWYIMRWTEALKVL